MIRKRQIMKKLLMRGTGETSKKFRGSLTRQRTGVAYINSHWNGAKLAHDSGTGVTLCIGIGVPLGMRGKER